MKSYKELFDYRFDESQKIDETFISVANAEGLSSAKKYLEEIGANILETNNYKIRCWIGDWTKSSSSSTEIIDKIKSLKDYVIDVDVKTNADLELPELVIKTINGEIRVCQFSRLFPNFKILFPDLEDENRLVNCHSFAYRASLYLGYPNDLVTGYIYGCSDKAKFLHSWVEVKLKDNDYIFDGTLNGIINKEGFYLMQYANPLSRISNVTLKNDVKTYMKKIKSVPLEVYFVYRDEIIKDLERNNQVFKK